MLTHKYARFIESNFASCQLSFCVYFVARPSIYVHEMIHVLGVTMLFFAVSLSLGLIASPFLSRLFWAYFRRLFQVKYLK